MERELTVADWRGYAQGQFPESAWSVDGDVLRAVAAGPRIDLISRERFRDFVLSFDWRLPRGGNSGGADRVNEETGPAFQTGPPMQLPDDQHPPDRRGRPTSFGAL